MQRIQGNVVLAAQLMGSGSGDRLVDRTSRNQPAVAPRASKVTQGSRRGTNPEAGSAMRSTRPAGQWTSSASQPAQSARASTAPIPTAERRSKVASDGGNAVGRADPSRKRGRRSGSAKT